MYRRLKETDNEDDFQNKIKKKKVIIVGSNDSDYDF